MENAMLILVVLGLLFTLGWLSANITATYVIYKSKNADQMIQFLLRDTYAMTIVGFGLWWIFPNITLVLMLLIVRAIILSSMNWNLIYDKYKEIKYEIDKLS